jgi:hypothetical protein
LINSDRISSNLKRRGTRFEFSAEEISGQFQNETERGIDSQVFDLEESNFENAKLKRKSSEFEFSNEGIENSAFDKNESIDTDETTISITELDLTEDDINEIVSQIVQEIVNKAIEFSIKNSGDVSPNNETNEINIANKEDISCQNQLDNNVSEVNLSENIHNDNNKTKINVIYFDESNENDEKKETYFNPFTLNNKSTLSKLYWILTLPLTTLFYFTIPGIKILNLINTYI